METVALGMILEADVEALDMLTIKRTFYAASKRIEALEAELNNKQKHYPSFLAEGNKIERERAEAAEADIKAACEIAMKDFLTGMEEITTAEGAAYDLNSRIELIAKQRDNF